MDGGGSDAFGSSSAPLTWHDFLERMRHPSAADFVKSIKSFIVSFSNKAPDPEKDSAALQEFLVSMEGAFKAHMLWAGSSEEELESAGEGLEKYVMTKLYNRAFASLPEDVKRDEELYEKITLVQQFIRPENLDIKPTFLNETSWLLAQKELLKINMYKAPRDKLVCILNCCRVINNLLLNVSISSNDSPPGADEFLPVLIYIVIKANPPQLHSNLVYIERYRRQSRLVSEAAYFFTNILSAESFIWNIDAQSLSMNETVFQKNMLSARAHQLDLPKDLGSDDEQNNREVREKKSDSENDKETNSYMREYHVPVQGNAITKNLDDDDHRISNKPSVSDLEEKGAIDLLKEDQPSQPFLEYPFLYAHSGDLTVDDVESLLNGYRQLVFKYVSLSRGISISNSSIPSSITQAQVKAQINVEPNDGEMEMKNENYEESIRTDDGSTDDLFPSFADKASEIHMGDLIPHPTAEKGEVLD